MTNEPEQQADETIKKESIRDSIEWVVNMMNEGKADPKQVYPSGGRYHGD